ncbi:MAG: helix-turn-helix domain-containing protein [Planctomycetales bacterium]|nr:helix-turn-helix domain-containing protein [Planctomycetales bacterium]
MANLQMLTVKEAAELLGVAANTIRNWERAGIIPAYRHPHNNYRLFRREDLEQVLHQVEESGNYPSGWARRVRPEKPKPR